MCVTWPQYGRPFKFVDGDYFQSDSQWAPAFIQALPIQEVVGTIRTYCQETTRMWTEAAPPHVSVCCFRVLCPGGDQCSLWAAGNHTRKPGFPNVSLCCTYGVTPLIEMCWMFTSGPWNQMVYCKYMWFGWLIFNTTAWSECLPGDHLGTVQYLV